MRKLGLIAALTGLQGSFRRCSSDFFMFSKIIVGLANRGFSNWISFVALMVALLTLFMTQFHHSHDLTVTVSSPQIDAQQARHPLFSRVMITNLIYTNAGTDDEVIVSSQVMVGNVQKKGYELAFEAALPPRVLKAGEAAVDAVEIPTSTVLKVLDRQPELPGPNGQPLPEFLTETETGQKLKVGHHAKATIFLRIVIVGREGPVAELLPIFGAESDFIPDDGSTPHYYISSPRQQIFSLRNCKICFLGETYGPASPTFIMQ